jgi:hypothetical protein
MANVETMFLVTVNTDGTFTTYSDIPKELPETNHVATTYEVYTTLRDIIREMESSFLADRVASVVLARLAPPPAKSASDLVADALNERGIKPETTATN